MIPEPGVLLTFPIHPNPVSKVQENQLITSLYVSLLPLSTFYGHSAQLAGRTYPFTDQLTGEPQQKVPCSLLPTPFRHRYPSQTNPHVRHPRRKLPSQLLKEILSRLPHPLSAKPLSDLRLHNRLRSRWSLLSSRRLRCHGGSRDGFNAHHRRA